LRHKLGLGDSREDDAALARELLERMAAAKADFTLTFRRLYEAIDRPERAALLSSMFAEPAGFEAWTSRWRARLERDAVSLETRKERMRLANPAFIARNHRVEEMIARASEGDLGPFERMLRVLSRPFDEQPDAADLGEPPGDEQWDYRTFCGT
jgi:uncharacterized protein YdiU (UPF0061 family)